MQALKVTQAREVDKSTITESATLVINGALPHQSTPVMQAGDFYFRPNLITTSLPTSWFRRTFLRQPNKIKTDIVYTVVMSCPFCGMPLMTTLDHHILSKTPLTIDKEIACPYAPKELGDTHAFLVKGGQIMTA